MIANRVNFSIADNDFFFKEFLVKALTARPSCKLLKNCNNGHELITQLYLKREDIFILSLYMPILSGLETIRILRQKNSETPVLAYSPTFQKDMDELLHRIPNVYYCQKNTIIIKDLVFKRILSRDQSYSEYREEWSQQENAVQNYYDSQKKHQEDLSLSEIHLMRLCYEGFSNKDIGDQLQLSARTVDTYIARLTQKLGLRSKIDLVRYCVENGFYNTNI